MVTRRILVIAGSDSSGGAGLEADQKVIAAHGCYAMTATTALTAQNTLGVQDIHHTPPQFLQKQIDAVCEDVGVDVVKTGMLASADSIEVVANGIHKHKIAVSVVDPVMVSTSGAQLLPEAAVSILIDRLLPLTTILTPNLPEAKLLLKIAGVDFEEPNNVDDMVDMAQKIQRLGPKWVLLKGGHLPLTRARLVSKEESEKDVVLNALVGATELTLMESEYLKSNNTHGTGCSLACELILWQRLKIIGRFIPYLLNREDVQEPWKQYTEHEFVQCMGNGTLPVEKFKYYMIQDYLFLVQFARATALSAYKSSSLKDIGRSVQQVVTLQKEIQLHIDFCKEYGLEEADITDQEEDRATTAYTRYVLDIGQSQDWLALQVALLPCLMGYGTIARRLYQNPQTVREGSKYWAWIEQYVGQEYIDAMARGSDLIEEHASKQSVSRIEELARIFIHATNMERGFWDMGLENRGASP
ncbi:trifunctional hydroxymethylpyrimidine kinase/phosphomethylpyrimidine kinase/thiaminase [Pleosporales sp. CAS-2024a]